MVTKKQKMSIWLMFFAILAVIITFGLIIITQRQQLQFSKILSIIGYIGLMFCLVYLYIYYFTKDLIYNWNKILLFLFINIIFISMIVFMSSLHYLLIPIPVAGMLISIMIDNKLGIITNIFLSIMGALISVIGFEFILFYIISGGLACIIVSQTKKRHKLVNVSIYLIVINILLVLFNNLYQYGSFSSFDFQYILFAVLNAVVSIIITTGSLPLWETLFDIVTPFKLLELTNSDQKLLQRMLLEAPGTYHHSQMVSNLSETATTAIAGNTLLARAGALYHDIGKLKAPDHFKENQNGINPHDELDAEISANIIINHVSYGNKLATEYRLPRAIKNIIQQHQGTTLVKYFYYKAKDNNEGFDIDEDLFRYRGPKPQTNEAAIVMLADCVEAYVRSLPESKRTLENIEKVIDEIIAGKLEEEQLVECELKIKELPVIANSFMKVYNGLYHERIKYPDNNVGEERRHVCNN